MRDLGSLESTVMELLWSHRGEMLPVREVQSRLKTAKPLAYTTVMTVLDNLYRKGFVEREKNGRAYQYRASSSRERHMAELMQTALDGTADRASALLHFVEGISSEEIAELRRVLEAFDSGADSR